MQALLCCQKQCHRCISWWEEDLLGFFFFFLQQAVILCIYISINTGQAKCGHKHHFHMLSAKKSTLSYTWSLASRKSLCTDKQFTAHEPKPSADAIVVALNVCIPRGYKLHFPSPPLFYIVLGHSRSMFTSLSFLDLNIEQPKLLET